MLIWVAYGDQGDLCVFLLLWGSRVCVSVVLGVVGFVVLQMGNTDFGYLKGFSGLAFLG
ncbi:hypothetical protein CDL15_Pgr019260 [Punica granatum]|uniref:Uncharacterized protein n=1 Tax=Punica granatum TaxID=22663 RepID=A0A218Y1K4_PUNGR|nr:hypothetical protein CDL15_Pgr019260 [Punica granatum]